MKTRRIAIAAATLALAAMAAAQNVRQIEVVTDITEGAEQYDRMRMWQAESVTYKIHPKRRNQAATFPGGAEPVWHVFKESNPTSLYVNATGTLSGATATIELTPAQSNIPTGDYRSVVAVYNGATYMGVIADADLTVEYSPASATVEYVGTYSPLDGSLLTNMNASTVFGSGTIPTNYLPVAALAYAAADGTNDLIATAEDVVAAIGGTTITWTSAPISTLHFALESELVTSITNVGTEVATSQVGDVTWVEVATNPIRQVRRWVQVPYRGSLSGRTNTQSAAPAAVATYDAATGLATQLTAGSWALTNVVTGGGETVTRWADFDWPANYALGGDAYILALPGGTIASQALVDVDAAIAGAGAAVDLLSSWATASSATSGSHYAWSTNLFYDAKRFAFQSVGDARSPGASGYNYGPLVLISSNAALTVLHSSSGGWVGDWVTFADTNGVSRLTYYQSLTDVGQDIGLVLLDPPLPPSVPVARLVDDADGAKLGATTGTYGTPLLYYDGNLHLYLARLFRTYESSFYGMIVEPFDKAARAAKYALLDHGGAFLLPTDDAMILVGMHYTTTSSRDWIPGLWTAISNACVTAGATVPTVYSLGAYNDR